MANAEHLELIQHDVEEWNQWRENNPTINPELSDTNLSGCNLSRCNLSGADLSFTNLGFTDLSFTNLDEAKLDGANLRHANLSRAKLSGVDLCQTTLIDATLSGANLSGFNLSGADLRSANLSGADLSGANLSGANLGSVTLSGADLSGANLISAYLRSAYLRSADLSATNLVSANLSEADLSKANLSGANLRSIDLRFAILSEADLSEANLISANLSEADLSKANLSEADLRRAQVLGTSFKGATFTGSCLEDWNTNSTTTFEDAICEYVYLKADQQERCPREGIFKPAEFATLFQQAVDTVDLIFKDGIDWQAFFQSFQDLRGQYADDNLSIQAIERKQGEAFVVRIEVAEGADKKTIESSAKEIYETKLLLLEQCYRAELQAKDGEIVAYREQSANLMKITEMLAARPPMSEGNKYVFNQTQFAGGFAETVQGDQIGGTINNAAAETLSLAEAAAEIQNLLKQLEASNPTATEADQTVFLNVMIPPTKRERFIGALKAASGTAIEEVPYGVVLKALVEGWQQPNG